MKTNRLMPDQSIEKIWDKFRKMNGIILTFVSTNWVAQSDGTFTNTVEYEGFTSKEILEVDLYDDGKLTETQISEYDGYITAFNINDGEIVAVASTQPTTNITVLCRGEIVTNGNGGGSVKVTKITKAAFNNLSKSAQQSGIYVIIDAEAKKISAKDIACDGSESGQVNYEVEGYPEYQTITINFTKQFESIPDVRVTVLSGKIQSTNAELNNDDLSYISATVKSVTKTNCTIEVTQNYTGAIISGVIGWTAEGNITVQNELNEQNKNLGGFTPIIDETGKITGYKTSVGGADTVFPFNKYNVENPLYCVDGYPISYTFENLTIGKEYIVIYGVYSGNGVSKAESYQGFQSYSGCSEPTLLFKVNDGGYNVTGFYKITATATTVTLDGNDGGGGYWVLF